jgi:hypothetical protein
MSQHLAAPVIALLLLAACATTTTASTPAAATPTAGAVSSSGARPATRTKLVCETPPGWAGRITRKRCRTVEQVDREREATQMELLRPRPTAPLGN